MKPFRPALTPVLVFLALVVATVSSLGAPLVPTIADATDVSLGTAQWSLTIGLLLGAVVTPVMGRVGDGPRRRELVLGTLVVVALGSTLAALPLGFGWLLLGRAMMGVGLGLTPLAMATARDALQGEQSRSAVALLSVTTVAGIGLGYPLTGLIADVLSFRFAFAFGAVVAVVALLAARSVFPAGRDRVAAPLDVVGGVLLGLGLAGLLLALTQVGHWSGERLVGCAAASVALLAAWVVQELRTEHPLVDLRLVVHRTVLTADVAALLVGIGMYMVMSTIIRFVQTPVSAGYGFGSSVVVAGLALVPMSVLSVVSSRVAPTLARRLGQRTVLPLGCGMFVAAEAFFLLERDHLWQVFVVMGVAGLGIGCTFAVMPALVLGSVPRHETGSAMSFNQVLRYVGSAVGSALSGTILQAHTPTGARLPTDSGYSATALVGMVVLSLAALVTAVLPARGTASAGPADMPTVTTTRAG
jgi:predicted MFS family arabinose efflux permease